MTAIRVKRALATGGVIALGLASMLVSFTAASATEAAPGNIDTSVTDGSITVHKHEATDTMPPAVGNPKTGQFIGGDPIAGAGFTAYPITSIDLANPSDWDGLSALTTAVSTSGTCEVPGETLGTPSAEQLTNAAGVTVFGGLSVGAYLVCETTLPTGAAAGAAPFIVTVPFPHKGEWLYNVHAFPKNTINTVEKGVSTTGYGVGSGVVFPVNTVIKALPNGESYTSFIMTDTFDGRLANPTIDSVRIDGVDVPFTAGGSDNTVTVTIDPAVINANIGKTIEFTFSARVVQIGSGTIYNTAALFVNDPNMEGDGIPSNTVVTQWGDLWVFKVDANSTSTGLAGARFEVYPASDPTAADCSTTTALENEPISIGGTTQFASNENGYLWIPGLFVSDSVTPANSSGQRCYFLKEVQAPAGFVTPTGNAAFTPIAVVAGETAEATVKIENTKQSVPNLPLTGGNGTAALVLGGIALAAIGTGVAIMRRRKVSA